ncbi:hypothetical protein [Algibacillus agarilyticus]|uniref:hypothetical protein n=1 Tax=Algibacillus agarilyticus TaxID=2234133 RepID=UPI001E476D26|nr:hypothetical protein [Algibacillus agarilyticus]
MQHISKLVVLTSTVLIISCGPAPVPKSDCAKVVAHAKNVLGDKAPSANKLLTQCQEGNDEQRGCVMAADKPMKILQCM